MRAVQRIGTADTAPADNWSGGGIPLRWIWSRGGLGAERVQPLKMRGASGAFSRHPDTGMRIEGAALPGWDTIRAPVLRAAAGVPFNPMAGWTSRWTPPAPR